MHKILFICHGNICRSVAAEYICKYLLKKYELDKNYFVFSRGTSNEEFGNDMYPPMKQELRKHGIPFDDHFARKVTINEIENSDYIFYMDNFNLRNLKYIDSKNTNKYRIITFLTNKFDEIEDPWYTGNFDKVFNQLFESIELIIRGIKDGQI